MTSTHTPYTAAMAAMHAGISVWPPRQDGSKAPVGSWDKGQSVAADAAQLEAWYSHGLTGVGFVCGAVSENLEVLDFDDRAAWTEFQRHARDAGLGELLDRVIAGYLEYSPNGAHLLYRCAVIDGSTKLAKRKKPDGTWKAIIETRGEGGYIIVAPSHGDVNASGAYELISGGPETIVDITPEERAELWAVARAFDETEARNPPPSRPTSLDRAGHRVGDDFNARATWAQVLEPHGWRQLFTSGGVTRWCRPGKKYGVSATTGYAGTDLLWVFTTSTVFEANASKDKFGAYAVLEHGGNFAEASKALALQSYGLEIPDHKAFPEVDLNPFLRNLFKNIGGEKTAEEAPSGPPSLDSLMKVPGAIGELAEWIDAGATLRQPLLALAASLAFFSALLGRKVRTVSNLRSNLYIISLAESGTGKERARTAIKQLVSMLGCNELLGGTFASGSSIEKAIERNPVRLFLVDEIGEYLGLMSNGRSEHLRDVASVLLTMYSSSDSSFQQRERASGESVTIEQPSLSIYGTTVGDSFYKNITKDMLTGGLLGRCLVLEASSDVPPLQHAAIIDPPASLLDVCKFWLKAPTNPDALDKVGEIMNPPAPLVVPTTVGAQRVIDSADEIFRAKVKAGASGGKRALFSRFRAMTWKIAMIRACGVDTNPRITEEDARWARDFVWRLIENLSSRVGGGAPENKTEDALQRVLDAITGAGAEGISRKDLIRKARFLSSKQLNEVVDTLQESGEVVAEVETTTAGRKKTTYKAVKQ